MTVILLSMVSYLYFYRSAHSIIKDNIVSDGHSELVMFNQEIDSKIDTLYKLIYKSQLDPIIRSIDGKKQADYYDYLQIRDYTQQVLATYPYIHDVLFYDKNNSLFVSNQGVFNSHDLVTFNFINEEKDELFWSEYLTKPNTANTYPKSDFLSQDTYYSKSLVIGYDIKKELSVVAAEHNAFKNFRMLIFLDASKMSEFYGENTLVYDMDKNEVLFDNTTTSVDIHEVLSKINDSGLESGSIDLKDSEAYIFYARSKSYGWYYLKGISYQKALDKIKAFNSFALLAIISMFFGSFFLSYFFSLKFYRPIQRLTDLVEKSSTELPEYFYGVSKRRKGNEMQKIYLYLTHINNNYEAIKRKYQMMQDIYKELFYVKLIKNDEADVNENIIKELNIDPADFNNFIVINYTLNFKSGFYKLYQNEDNVDKITLSIKELIDMVLKNMSINSYSFQIDLYSSIAILPLADKNFDIRDFERKVSSMLKNDSDILYVNFAISKVYQGLSQLKAAYIEATKLSEYHSIKMQTQFATAAQVKQMNNEKIPRRLYIKIRSIVELLKLESFNDSIGELTRYLEETAMPITYVKKGLITMVNDILGNTEIDNRIAYEGLDSIYKDIDTMRSKDDYNNIIERINNICSDPSGEVDYNCRNYVVEDMVTFMKENFSDEISLELFSEKYRLSPIYLSKLFKDFKGVNYTDYLNEIRMEKALDFLLNTDIKVKDISTKIGYKDPNAFIRAFKNNYGISPGKYRRINIVNG